VSRDLDREFAEKVLGHKWYRQQRGGYSLDFLFDPNVRRFSPDGEPADVGRKGHIMWECIKTYSRSLDAAWSGVEKLDPFPYVEFQRMVSLDNRWRCRVRLEIGVELRDREELADHPAEALVRALLAAKDSNA